MCNIIRETTKRCSYLIITTKQRIFLLLSYIQGHQCIFVRVIYTSREVIYKSSKGENNI